MKKYNQSPLPFQGQKRRFVRPFRESLQLYNESNVFIDLFGGSGLLSHTVKSELPEARVIYNDYDDFKQRLNAIETTNALVQQFREILKGVPKGAKLQGHYREEVLKVLKRADQAGYVDYITLSSQLKFSMNYSTNLRGFTHDTMYNNVRLSTYDATGYLEGVEIIRDDYKAIFKRFKDVPGVVFLVDPPYLSTDSTTYNSDGFWKLRDYLDVLQVLVDQDYFYFTSNKSQIVELCEWISSVSSTANPFENSIRTDLNTNVTHTASYTDIMYRYKKGS